VTTDPWLILPGGFLLTIAIYIQVAALERFHADRKEKPL
jgi:hypothetical protein